MDSIFKALGSNQPVVTLVLASLVLILAATMVVMGLRFRSMSQRWNDLMKTEGGANLERLLYDHLRERVRQDEELTEIRKRLDTQESKMSTAKRYAGLVRFDAFPEVGGKLSFALALYDEKGDGIVISSLIGRADCRVFCKEIQRGKAERELTREEMEAVEQAAGLRNRALTTA